MQKSSSQKALKVISIIMIVFAGLTLALSLLTLIGGGAMGFVGASGADDSTLLVGGMVMVLGMIMLVGGGINLVIGIFGLRGANNPQKIGVFYVLSIIGVVWAVINALVTIAGTSMDASSLISVICGLILPVACCALAFSIKKENNL